MHGHEWQLIRQKFSQTINKHSNKLDLPVIFLSDPCNTHEPPNDGSKCKAEETLITVQICVASDDYIQMTFMAVSMCDRLHMDVYSHWCTTTCLCTFQIHKWCCSAGKEQQLKAWSSEKMSYPYLALYNEGVIINSLKFSTAPCCSCLIQLNIWLLRSIVYLAPKNFIPVCLSICLSEIISLCERSWFSISVFTSPVLSMGLPLAESDSLPVAESLIFHLLLSFNLFFDTVLALNRARLET